VTLSTWDRITETRIRAAMSVLDRTGMGPSSSTEVTVSASLHLMELIRDLDG
jgi:hypothetical protein